MSVNLRNFTRSVYAFDAVVQRVPADQWAAPTPCVEWNAAELVAHQCAVLNGVKLMAETGQMAPPTPSPDADPVSMWNACRDGVLAALDGQGVLAQPGPFWFRAATIDEVCAAVQWDPVTHAWDLATATGIDHGLDDELIEITIAQVAPRAEMLVTSGRTAEQSQPVDATPLARYLAMVGRSSDGARPETD